MVVSNALEPLVSIINLEEALDGFITVHLSQLPSVGHLAFLDVKFDDLVLKGRGILGPVPSPERERTGGVGAVP
jgi:hypothetical protein